jgi:hypothetical protein
LGRAFHQWPSRQAAHVLRLPGSDMKARDGRWASMVAETQACGWRLWDFKAL